MREEQKEEISEEITKKEALKKLLIYESQDSQRPEERFRRLKLVVKMGMEMMKIKKNDEGLQQMLDERILMREEKKRRVKQEKKVWQEAFEKIQHHSSGRKINKRRKK